MDEFLSRTTKLIGKENVNKLINSKIAIFGIGGVGGYAFEALVRAGVGQIDVFDSDKVTPSNLNRQIIATCDTIGMYKTEAAKKRAESINPKIKVNTFNVFFLPENAHEFDFKQYDYIVDAVDTVSAKIAIVTKAKNGNVPVISSMGTGNKLNPTMFEVDDIYNTSVCPLAKVMRKELKVRGVKDLKVVYSKEEPKVFDPDSKQRTPASISFTPSVAGLIIASEVVKDLIK